MKEFILTQSYATIEEMINSEEVAVIKEELNKRNIDLYAIVSHIGNRYNIYGEKINGGYAQNPYLLCQVQEDTQNVVEPVIEEIKEEETDMKYAEIEALIDAEIKKAVDNVKAEYELKISAYENDIAVREEEHKQALANAKAEAKAELLAKLND